MALVGDGRHFSKHGFQGQRCGNTGYHDQQNNGCEINGIDNADLKTLLRYDQGNLAAGHHADTDLEGITPVETADFGGQTAADDLAQQRNDHKADAEQQNLGVKPLMSVFKPMLAKKMGAKIR